jgi:carbon-monoxide dehydrogenase medium subunit
VEQTASGFALVGIAARIQKAAGKISLARVGVTGLAPRPFRAANVEALLLGPSGAPDDLRRAAAVIGEGEDANTDLHASAEYRRHLARVHAARALAVAVSRAS